MYSFKLDLAFDPDHKRLLRDEIFAANHAYSALYVLLAARMRSKKQRHFLIRFELRLL